MSNLVSSDPDPVLMSAMPDSAESIFVFKYLSEFESICKTVLVHESGDPGVQFNEKTEGRKSLETIPLRGRGGGGL
jgi:hypothetical protein